jgi:hypothetical protein
MSGSAKCIGQGVSQNKTHGNGVRTKTFGGGG